MHTIRKYIRLLEDETPIQHAQQELVFVYGSLKAGFYNHGFLEHMTFLGKAISPPRFAMLDLGSFPAVIRGKHHITGEIYAVDRPTMADLDRLEGNGLMYQRELCPFRIGGKQVRAWIY